MLASKIEIIINLSIERATQTVRNLNSDFHEAVPKLEKKKARNTCPPPSLPRAKRHLRRTSRSAVSTGGLLRGNLCPPPRCLAQRFQATLGTSCKFYSAVLSRPCNLRPPRKTEDSSLSLSLDLSFVSCAREI